MPESQLSFMRESRRLCNRRMAQELRVGRTSCAPRDAERWFSGL